MTDRGAGPMTRAGDRELANMIGACLFAADVAFDRASRRLDLAAKYLDLRDAVRDHPPRYRSLAEQADLAAKYMAAFPAGQRARVGVSIHGEGQAR